LPVNNLLLDGTSDCHATNFSPASKCTTCAQVGSWPNSRISTHVLRTRDQLYGTSGSTIPSAPPLSEFSHHRKPSVFEHFDNESRDGMNPYQTGIIADYKSIGHSGVDYRAAMLRCGGRAHVMMLRPSVCETCEVSIRLKRITALESNYSQVSSATVIENRSANTASPGTGCIDPLNGITKSCSGSNLCHLEKRETKHRAAVEGSYATENDVDRNNENCILIPAILDSSVSQEKAAFHDLVKCSFSRMAACGLCTSCSEIPRSAVKSGAAKCIASKTYENRGATGTFEMINSIPSDQLSANTSSTIHSNTKSKRGIRLTEKDTTSTSQTSNYRQINERQPVIDFSIGAERNANMTSIANQCLPNGLVLPTSSTFISWQIGAERGEDRGRWSPPGPEGVESPSVPLDTSPEKHNVKIYKRRACGETLALMPCVEGKGFFTQLCFDRQSADQREPSGAGYCSRGGGMVDIHRGIDPSLDLTSSYYRCVAYRRPYHQDTDEHAEQTYFRYSANERTVGDL
jgi:hypothetical protein